MEGGGEGVEGGRRGGGGRMRGDEMDGGRRGGKGVRREEVRGVGNF